MKVPVRKYHIIPAPASRLVASNQRCPHPRVAHAVRRHLAQAWLQPLHPPSERAFARVQELLTVAERQRVVLDSGCGTGASAWLLARHHPDCVVVGVDRSATRLARGGVRGLAVRSGRVILVRARLETFWRLALRADWRPVANYLLYPNPWPKAAHLGRRWHAHPVFPDLLALGGEIVLRCNWEIYAREFATAVAVATGAAPPPVRSLRGDDPLSPFERKYRGSGHALFELRVPRRASGSHR